MIVSTSRPPAFLITIDTEGDNLWSRPREITTNNANFLPRFQSLCEHYKFKPTYLTNYEMAQSESFVEFGRNILHRKTGEIGMHLHAWNSPPLKPLTHDDFYHQPFLTEYPELLMREKIIFMTELLENKFDTKIVSHRAGRWSFNNIYASLLIKQGYYVDCSVTPYISWQSTLGNPKGKGGIDFSHYPDYAYFLDLDDISKFGQSSLLELPMTIMACHRPRFIQMMSYIPLVGKGIKRFWPNVNWLRPNGRNLKTMLTIINQAISEQRPYIEFMLHSSELMPGGSPTFKNKQSIEKLYNDLEFLFEAIQRSFIGMTLGDYYIRVIHAN